MKLAMLALLAVAIVCVQSVKFCEPPVGLMFAPDELINEKEAAPRPFNSFDGARIMATCAKEYEKYDFESQREICDQYAGYFVHLLTRYYTERNEAQKGQDLL